MAQVGQYGEGLGNALGGILAGVPQQRREMAMQLAQTQATKDQYLQQMQLMQQRQEDLDRYRQDRLGMQQQIGDQKNTFNQQSLDQRSKYQDAMTMIQGLKAQVEANKAAGMADRPVHLGNGLFYAPPSQGQAPTAVGAAPAMATSATPGAVAAQPPMVEQNQGLPSGATMIGQTPGGGKLFRMDASQGLNTPKPATGGQELISHQKNVEQYMQALNAPKLTQVDPRLLGMLSNQVYNTQSPMSAQQPQGLPQGSPVSTNTGGVTIKDKQTGQPFIYRGNPQDIPTNQFDIIQ
jgi:hypothetical protein